jgi:AraC-like DNA-binding protein
MTQNKDISAHFPGLTLIHQKIRGNQVGNHQHSAHEFFFPLQGTIQIRAGDKDLKAGSGKIIYLPPDISHSFNSDSASQGERLILIFQPSLWKKNSRKKFEASTLSASQLCKEVVFQLLIYPKTKAAKALITTLVQTLAEMLEANNCGSEGEISHLSGRTDDDRIKKALSYIEEHFFANTSANQIAKYSGLSVRNLNRLFLQETGMSPKQAMTLVRIDQAKKILKTGKRSVTDTALDVGYSSVSQFISTFRKYTGQVPSTYMPFVK